VGSLETARYQCARSPSDYSLQPKAHSLNSVPDRVIRAFIDAFAKILTGFEVRHVFSGEGDRFPGLGIPTLARRTKMERKASEPTDLDAPALRERIAHDLEDLFDCQLDVLRRQVLLFRCNELDEFRFGHVGPVVLLAGSAGRRP
jgi:hypothetical protein